MKLRYLALLGEAVSGAKVRQGAYRNRELASWNVSNDLFVQCSDGLRCHFLPNDSGVVIGTLFHRYGAPSEIEHLEPEDAHAIVKTRARHLVDRFWGRYIAILRLDGGNLVLRDPSGLLPGYVTEVDGAIAVASDPDTLFLSGLAQPDIDRSGLAKALAFGQFPVMETALRGIRRLLPGMCLSKTSHGISMLAYWKPASFVNQPGEVLFEEQVEKLRRITQFCVTAWSKVFRQPLLTVSGGLDSSIVAALLAIVHPRPHALTVSTNDPLGDERRHCDPLVEHLDLKFRAERYNLDLVDLGRSSSDHLAAPSGRPDALAYDAAISGVAREIGADAIFSGNGGDSVFYMSRSARPLVDRYLEDGIVPALTATIGDISMVTGASSLQVIKEGFRVWRSARRGYSWPVDTSYLASDQFMELAGPAVEHPWLGASEACLPPGKQAHLAMMMRMQPSVEAYVERDGVPIIHPLLSQPIVEACLAIPTWHQCMGGYDRAVARRAFADLLPKPIIERRAKGSPQGFAFEIFHRFKREIRERLLDGYLLHEGILGRSGIEHLLRPDANPSAEQVLRLLSIVDAEAWARNWKSTVVNLKVRA